MDLAGVEKVHRIYVARSFGKENGGRRYEAQGQNNFLYDSFWRLRTEAVMQIGVKPPNFKKNTPPINYNQEL